MPRLIIFAQFIWIMLSSIEAKSFYELQATSIDGKSVSFETYKNKVILVVNVASRCGFTNQYKGLSEIYEKYHAQGFEILAFPCNQFLNQEPESEAQIKKFCEDNYRVKFPLFKKGDVNGDNRQPVYQWILENAPEGERHNIRWNFTKFVIDRKGRVVDRFAPTTKPTDSKITQLIDKLLKE